MARLARGGAALRRRSHDDLAELLAACRRSVAAVADRWVEGSLRSKGWQSVPHAHAEEWASGPLPVARFLQLLEHLHRGLAAGRLPALHPAPRAGEHTTAYAALPAPGLGDRLLLAGHRAQIECPADAVQREPERHGDVALVLGAGNVTATPVLDVLHQVFLLGRAVACKVSPLHEPLLEVLRAALQPLADAGLLHLVGGAADAGAVLARDPAIAAVHLTGSVATWTRLRGDPTLAAKERTAEVGCCTPAFVVPGTWRDWELRHVARQLAAFVACNGGATCLAPRLLLTARGWPQREAFLQHLRAALAALPARVPFHGACRDDYARASGKAAATAALPAVLRDGLDAERDHALFAAEHFAPVLLETPLAGDDAAAWLDRATGLVRDHVYGALSACAFAPPRVLGRNRTTIEAALRSLGHGSIILNGWTGLGYGLGVVPWGVPATARWQHGAGFTRGTLCLSAMTRTVIEAPFRPHPLPPWLPTHRTGTATLRALTRQWLIPSPLRLLRTALLALASP